VLKVSAVVSHSAELKVTSAAQITQDFTNALVEFILLNPLSKRVLQELIAIALSELHAVVEDLLARSKYRSESLILLKTFQSSNVIPQFISSILKS